jgi:hypothetical protein
MCYAYNAALLCDDCANEVMKGLDCDGCEDTGDTNDYPQYCNSDESDCPEHCDHCNCFLENDLTSDGEEYVRNAVRDDLESGCNDSVAVMEWMPHYSYIDYGPEDFCAHCGAWALCNDEDLCEDCADPEPVEEDFTITPCGPLGGKSALGRIGGKFIGEFDCDDSAIKAAMRIMQDEGYWPNIWIVSDHGNWLLYTGENDNE